MAQTTRIIPGSRRRRVIAVLVQHGLTQAAAMALYRRGRDLRQRMLQQPNPAQWVEHAGMVDAQTGQRLGRVAIGGRDGVDIASQLLAAQGRRAASVHTHPGSSSFSPPDAELLIEERVLALVAVIGADRTWYVLSGVPGSSLPAVARMRHLYATTALSLRPAYQAMALLGITSEERAWQELTDETWETIALTLGLRYDRVG